MRIDGGGDDDAPEPTLGVAFPLPPAGVGSGGRPTRLLISCAIAITSYRFGLMMVVRWMASASISLMHLAVEMGSKRNGRGV